MSSNERDQDIVALGRLITYAQLEAKRLELEKTETDLRAALSSLLDDAADLLTADTAAERVGLIIDQV
jgi:hypothetical protein